MMRHNFLPVAGTGAGVAGFCSAGLITGFGAGLAAGFVATGFGEAFVVTAVFFATGLAVGFGGTLTVVLEAAGFFATGFGATLTAGFGAVFVAAPFFSAGFATGLAAGFEAALTVDLEATGFFAVGLATAFAVTFTAGFLAADFWGEAAVFFAGTLEAVLAEVLPPTFLLTVIFYKRINNNLLP